MWQKEEGWVGTAKAYSQKSYQRCDPFSSVRSLSRVQLFATP